MPYFHKLYENGELPQRAKLVYLYLFDRKDRDGKAWPGIKRMAADLSVSRSTVKRAIKDLEKAKLIRKEAHFRENGSSTSNRYYLLWVPKIRYRPPRGNCVFSVDRGAVQNDLPWRTHSKWSVRQKRWEWKSDLYWKITINIFRKEKYIWAKIRKTSWQGVSYYGNIWTKEKKQHITRGFVTMTIHFDVGHLPPSETFYQSDPPSFYDGNSPCAFKHYAFERNTFVSARM